MCLAALGVASSLLGASSSISQGNAQSNAYKQQASQARANSEALQQQAQNTAMKGAQEERQIKRQGESTVGKQKTIYGASNIDTGSGSALDVITNTQNESLSDQLQTRRNTANQVWSQESEAMNQQTAARNYDSAASNAKKSGRIGAMTSLLSGSTQLSNNYDKYKKTGGTKTFWNW
jgi:hypothetical protein